MINIVQDVKITYPDGKTQEFKAVAKKVMRAAVPGSPVWLEFFSILETAMGLVVLAPGMTVEYLNAVATTSQVDSDTGMVAKIGEDE